MKYPQIYPRDLTEDFLPAMNFAVYSFAAVGLLQITTCRRGCFRVSPHGFDIRMMGWAEPGKVCSSQLYILRLCRQIFVPISNPRCFGPVWSPWLRSLHLQKHKVRILCCVLVARRLLLTESILLWTLTHFHPHTCIRSLEETHSTLRYPQPTWALSQIALVAVTRTIFRITGRQISISKLETVHTSEFHKSPIDCYSATSLRLKHRVVLSYTMFRMARRRLLLSNQ